MQEVDDLCHHFGPLTDEFVKMAGIVPDSSSSDAEEDGDNDDADDSFEWTPCKTFNCLAIINNILLCYCLNNIFLHYILPDAYFLSQSDTDLS